MARYMRTSTVISRQIAGELVLVPIIPPGQSSGPATANFYVLNSTAELLWERLAAPADENELAVQLVDRFDVDEAAARSDVAGFLKDLLETGAIVQVTGAREG